MNRSLIFRPLTSAAVLALVAVAQPGFAALSQATLRPVPPVPAKLSGTLVALHRAQRGGNLAVSNGAFYNVRFASVAQKRSLRVGSRLSVSGDARSQVRLVVQALRIQGASPGAHLRGVVVRRLGGGTVELLGMDGAAMVLNLGHARIARVHRAGGLFSVTSASADEGLWVVPGDEIDTPVTLTGAGPVATGTATVAALPPVQVEVEGLITAVNAAAGTITVQGDDGPPTVVALGAAGGTYYLGQDVKVYGTVIAARSNSATVQAQYISVDSPDGDGGDNDGGDNGGDGD